MPGTPHGFSWFSANGTRSLPPARCPRETSEPRRRTSRSWRAWMPHDLSLSFQIPELRIAGPNKYKQTVCLPPTWSSHYFLTSSELCQPRRFTSQPFFAQLLRTRETSEQGTQHYQAKRLRGWEPPRNMGRPQTQSPGTQRARHRVGRRKLYG